MQAVLEALLQALDGAQNERALAEIGLLEAEARAAKAREEAERLEAAVAALRGESRAAPAPAKRPPVDENVNTNSQTIPDYGSSEPNPPVKRVETAAETAEIDAWERERAEKMRRKAQEEKERRASDPMANFRCPGCGNHGTMAASIIQAPSGVPIRMLVCGDCGNQLMG